MPNTIFGSKRTQGRAHARLGSNFDRHLAAYAAAATAAGIGLFAPQSAEAKIVYTAANVTIVADQAPVNLDLNNDGLPDFSFYLGVSIFARHPEGGFASSLGVYPARTGNEVWGVLSAKGFECAAALPPAVKIGSGAAFKPGGQVMWQASGSYTRGATEHCPWNALHRGAFLGLKFVVNGQTHYGWAHVTVGQTTVLNGYAYETVPNKSIDTGKAHGPVSIGDVSPDPLPLLQPGTLGMLAQGSRGLSLWRREDDQIN
jgi:hypothetical protein